MEETEYQVDYMHDDDGAKSYITTTVMYPGGILPHKHVLRYNGKQLIDDRGLVYTAVRYRERNPLPKSREDNWYEWIYLKD